MKSEKNECCIYEYLVMMIIRVTYNSKRVKEILKKIWNFSLPLSLPFVIHFPGISLYIIGGVSYIVSLHRLERLINRWKSWFRCEEGETNFTLWCQWPETKEVSMYASLVTVSWFEYVQSFCKNSQVDTWWFLSLAIGSLERLVGQRRF